MPRHAPPDPDAVQHAIDEMAKGRSTRDIAADLQALGVSVSHVTVARWAKAGKGPVALPPKPAAAALAVAERAARAADPGPMVAPKPSALATELAARKQAEADAPKPATIKKLELDPEDVSASMRRLVLYAEEMVNRHAGNHDGKEGDGVIRIANLLKELRIAEKGEQADANMLIYPRAEYDAAHATLIKDVINPLRAKQGRAPWSP